MMMIITMIIMMMMIKMVMISSELMFTSALARNTVDVRRLKRHCLLMLKFFGVFKRISTKINTRAGY